MTCVGGATPTAAQGNAPDPTAAPAPATANLSLDRILWQVPDPDSDRPEAMKRLEAARAAGNRAQVTYIERVLEMVDTIRRPTQVHLSLEDVVHRTLANSYTIKLQSYNPAIETTRVVEAQAAFDAVFFGSINNTKVDRPTSSQLFSSEVDNFVSSVGIRKLLQSGMQVSGVWRLDRTKTALAFQSDAFNPAYTSTLTLEARQPLLRGFGIDFNRSTIILTKNTRSISYWAFRRQVRDTLRQVEEQYWRLVQARRDVTITARLLADFEAIYSYLEARREFDVIPVQLNATSANLQQTKADFIQRRANVFNAEDRLIALMNDPQIPTGGGVEIIPKDFLELARVVVDVASEVQTALDHRPELKEQELSIANATIAVGQAENLSLPRADVIFRYTVDGLGGNFDNAFSDMSTNNFISYFVGVEFDIPIGNRGPRAVHQRARLQHAQAEAALKARFEEILLDVHLAVRQLNTSYDQIPPSFESAEARYREVDSIVARAERKDFNTLNSELGARQGLANDRRSMLGAMVNYNIAIIDLERAKGTLLNYNNVVIPPVSD